MRVLFTTTPGWGHVHPMVPLARAFAGRGDEVLWAAAAEVCPRLEGAGFQTKATGLGLDESHREFDRLYPEYATLPPVERRAFMFPRLFGPLRTSPMLADLIPVARHFEPSVIVRDAAEFAAPIAATNIGVPCVTHSFGGLISPQFMASASDAVAPLWDEHGLPPQPYCGSYEHLYLDIYPPSLQTSDMAHVPCTELVRPVAFATGVEEKLPELITKESPRPLIYVTLGTVFNRDMSLISTVLEGLSDLAVRVVVTVGPAGDPSLLANQPPSVHVARYIPQTQLLSRCAAVVSHAGSGTFLAALALGLPQLCLPQAADQFINAEACVRIGAGFALEAAAVTATAIGDAVERLLSDPQPRSVATHLSREIAQMPHPHEVAERIVDRFRA